MNRARPRLLACPPACLLVCLLACLPATGAAAGERPIVVDQGSARNVVWSIQARNPFVTRSVSRTVRTGHTTVTEIVEIGPEPAPLSIRQVGLVNRASAYQRGTAPNLDVRQSGFRNVQVGRQVAMP